MTRLKTVIVDDEPLALRIMKTYLLEIPEVEVVAECSNGREAIRATYEKEPDLMFLDIQMPGINGFEVVRKLQSDIMPMIVFCTGFEKYALDAFDVNAVDYVLKPIDRDRINRAVKRSLARFTEVKGSGDYKPAIMGALDAIARRVNEDLRTEVNPEEELQKSGGPGKKLAIKDRDSITLVNQDDIDWVDAAGDYMCIHVGGTTHIMRATLKNLLKELDEGIFKQVHRSTIVNLNRIQKITPCSKGEFLLHIVGDEKIKVSRNYRNTIKDFIEVGL